MAVKRLKILFLITLILVSTAFLFLLLISQPNVSILPDLQHRQTINSARFMVDGVDRYLPLPVTINTRQPFIKTVDVSGLGDLHAKSLAVFVTYTDFACVIDGKVVYRYEIDKRLPLRSGGYSIHVIDLPASIKSKLIEFHFKPALPSLGYYKMTPIDFGTRSKIFISHLLYRDLWVYLINFGLLAIFVITLIFFITARNSPFNRQRLLAIGMLCLCISGYFFPQLWSFNYLFSRFHTVIYLMEYTSLMLLGVPVLILMINQLRPVFNRWFIWLMVALVLNCLVQYALSFLGLIEFKQMLWVTHLLLFGSSVIIVLAFLTSPAKMFSAKRQLVLSIVPILASMVLGVISYWLTERLALLELLSFGVVVFVAIQLYLAVTNYIAFSETTMRNRIYEKLALKDALTRLDNRNAFVKFEDEERQSRRACMVISIDLNHLKQINDTLGHVTGDHALVTFARLLRESLSQYPSARCFRMGGDEFMAFVFEPDFDFAAWVGALKSACIVEAQKVDHLDLAFAAGYAKYEGRPDIPIEKVIEQSDHLMYQDKVSGKRSAPAVND